MATNDPLEEYRAKRDFDRTAEPAGGTAIEHGGRRFVVQRHRARRRHYDLRLEHDGALLSWAVPKGPTLDPGTRRLAVRVEDHPVEYAEFEGVIPAGEYGGGDVIVWDRGTWEPATGDDVRQQLADGSLHFDVEAEKVRGRFVLTRTGSDGGKEQWLLIHKHDDHAIEGWDAEDHPVSVLSGRTNEEVAAEPDLTWHSDRPAAEAATPTDRVRFAAAEPDELEALANLDDDGPWEIGGQVLSVTNLDKVLFAARHDEEPVTKRELLGYYVRVAPYLLPYLKDRPVNLHRYPDGAAGSGFWQKAVPDGAPEWIRRWRNPLADAGETEWYSVLDSTPALAWAANLAGFELHPWVSRADDPQHPTWAYIDIDPGPRTSHDDLLLLVRLHRTALEHLGVEARPKTSGRRGFQIWIPIAPDYTFERDPCVGGDAVAGHRRHGSRAGQLAMAQGRARGAGPPRLHAERHQQDAGGAVQRPPRTRRARVGAARVGRAGRPRAALGPLDHPRRAGSALRSG